MGNTENNYYLHEPYENEWLLTSVYPYEVPIKYINAKNNDQLGAADIIIQKEIIRKISGKGGCEDKSITNIVECWKNKLAESLSKVNISCKVGKGYPTYISTDRGTVVEQ